MHDYIAYAGQAFQIEWYYTAKGGSQALEYASDMSKQDIAKLIHLLERMGDHGRIHDKTRFRHEADKIYAFKPQPHRFLCFFTEGKKIIITNAFWKKQDKLPKSEKEQALKCRADYLERVQQDIYYEQES